MERGHISLIFDVSFHSYVVCGMNELRDSNVCDAPPPPPHKHDYGLLNSP
jgi:hypothetical protein